MNPHLDDTIVAISTPPGRGGIGVVRLSGGRAMEIATRLLRNAAGKGLTFEPGRAVFALLIESDTGERIDEAVVTFFQSPHSYTGEDVIEISTHGSPVVLRNVIGQAISQGARLAEPGEFTMRAFFNGRIDLTQAEAVRDLIDSQTLFQAKSAAQQLSGALSKRIQPVKQQLMNLIAALEAGVDFAEDDVSVMPDEQITARITEVVRPLQELSRSIGYGKLVHDGLKLAIIGRPNVGKSSLFNRLIERDHAIVTATPGTTRDLVSETISIGGIPVKLIDTAGLRESNDEAERIGIAKSQAAAAEADAILLVSDATDDQSADSELLALARMNANKTILVRNKSDLAKQGEPVGDGIATSALLGEGIDELRRAILQSIGGESSAHEPGFLTNERQHGAVTEALVALTEAQDSVQHRRPHEVLLLELYAGLKALDALTGATSTDDILALIFQGFCIGK